MAERPIKSLSELMDGGPEERFNIELGKVWDNIRDPNTNAKTPREIILKVKAIPNERRDAAEFKVTVTSKLAPMVELTQTVMLQFKDDGSVIATERTDQVPGQIKMDGTEQPLPKVLTLGKAEPES